MDKALSAASRINEENLNLISEIVLLENEQRISDSWRRKMKRKPNTPINQVQWLDFQKHHQNLKEIFNILATWIKNNGRVKEPHMTMNPMP